MTRRTILVVVVLLMFAVAAQATTPDPARHRPLLGPDRATAEAKPLPAIPTMRAMAAPSATVGAAAATSSRPWVKVGAVAYQTSPDIAFESSHYQWLDNPHSDVLPKLRAAGWGGTALTYVETCSSYIDDWMDCCWKKWAAANGAVYEDAYLHFNSGGKVPIVYAGSTNRYVMNPRSASYQKFWVYFANLIATTTYGGYTYDGIFVDDGCQHILDNQASGPQGVKEYPDVSGDIASQYDKDMTKVYAAIRQSFGAKGAAGSKQLWVNTANYIPDGVEFIYPYIDGVFREFVVYPSSMYADRLSRLATANATAKAAGVASVVGVYGIDTADKFALACYYVASDPSLDVFCRQDSNSDDLATYAWVSALDTDVGTPTGPATVSGGTFTRKFTKATVTVNPDNGTASITSTSNPPPTPTPPVAAFTASPTSGAAPLSVTFTDASTNTPTAWAWTFGDGGASQTKSPNHTYSTAGTYSVGLTVTNAGGQNTATKAGYITVTGTPPPPAAPVASFIATPTSGAAPLAVAFRDTSTGAPTAWSWAFGDGSTSTAQAPSHTYVSAGSYQVTLAATNAAGSSSATGTVSVSTAPPPPATVPVPKLSASLSATTITLRQSVTLTVTMQNAGGAAQVSGMTASFPGFAASGDQTRVSLSGSGLTLGRYVAGATIWGKSGSSMRAKYLLAEGWKPTWAAGESRTFTLKITPKARGTFTIYVRGWMQGGSTEYVDPATGTTSDQQGWPVQALTVTVR